MSGSCLCVFRGMTRKVIRLCPRVSSTVRLYSAGCEEPPADKCKKVGKDFPCGKPKLQAEKKPVPKPKEKFQSMWPNPFCDFDDPTCPYNPRFDDLYYIESDKAKRKYWQTWVSCPPVQIKKKKICCFEKTTLPPVMRRAHKKPQTACEVPPEDCRETKFDKCLRLKRRCHKAGRIPPTCKELPTPKDCVKPLTPYPAFSECKRLKSNARPLSECLCWNKPALCEVWAEWRKRNMASKIK
ncbi:uncharacterized protein LOC115625322 [Scaptodrosophila lebanonensis]|uniref:Uncharacterized protein LOC115625322 n=1 Tax=Drosophila lebanonensis TaxID=7225 RepID=A0A6J2TM42_DROLE|nr:uncharacterized protein LOC115625322 [Scaptodrosophila lebanonensis]